MKTAGDNPMNAFDSERLNALNILVVDDDTMNQVAFRRLLSRWGISCQIARNGKEALEFLMQDKGYDMVLMDFDMPVMGGIEATRKIRSLNTPYFQQLPIIAITASTEEIVEEVLQDCGMNDFIPKPIFSKDLADLILRFT